jgi:PadR family transcriptional regulator PadR
MRRGAAELCVLALLRDGEKYGFEIAKAVAGADGLVASEGTIYPLLSRLRGDGLVKTTWRDSVEGPPRRYYNLTKSGSAELEALSTQWVRFRDVVDSILESRGGRQ